MPRALTDWISGYLQHSMHTESPEHFHFWSAVSTIAGALRRKTWLDMGYWQWFPNFYIFLVAPPGVAAKSTTINITMQFLHDLEFVKFGPDSASWQAFVKFLAEAREDYLMPDGTYLPMCSMTVASAELGSFLNPRDHDQMNIMTDLWDCKTGEWSKVTKTQGNDGVINPWVNIIGCTTPSWIADNFTDSMIGGGFASRAIFVYAEKKRKLVAYPQLNVSSEFEDEKRVLLADLHEISQLAGPFTMTEDAYEWGEEWYKKHYTSEHKHLPGERFKGYLSRKQTHLHKLAMVLSASRSDSMLIEPQDLARAEKYLRATEETLPRVFGQMNREQAMRMAAEVIDIVRKAGSMGVSKAKLYRDNFVDTIGHETFEGIIHSLVMAQMLKPEQVDNTIMLKARFHKEEKEEDDEPETS